MKKDQGEVYGIATEGGMFGELNLKDDPTFVKVEKKTVEEEIEEAIERNKKALKK